MLKINRPYLSEMETGKADPGLSMLETIAAGFGLTLVELLTGLKSRQNNEG
jgi:transcriptional regulator with XRE-family HTH domain